MLSFLYPPVCPLCQKEILEKKPTPLEAQAVLVTTWETVLRNAKLNLPSQKSETGQFRS